MGNFGFDQTTGGVVNAPPSLEMGGYSQGVSGLKGKHLLVIVAIVAVIYIYMKKKGS